VTRRLAHAGDSKLQSEKARDLDYQPKIIELDLDCPSDGKLNGLFVIAGVGERF
jgi:hypothetical protein